jgi:SAM-dependent methyltransferase
LNGLLTVAGGLLAVLFSIQWGFRVTLLIAAVCYLAALLFYARMRTASINCLSDSLSTKSQIARYWNHQVHDRVIATQPEGTRGFFAELDTYRYEKLGYLHERVDFDSCRGKRLLEVGCGVGTDLVRFARAGAVVTGIDLAPISIELARKNFAQQGLPADLCVMDGEAMSFADASFDLVYAHGVLQYTADAAGMVAEIHRVLCPGGEAIVMLYNRHSWLNALSVLMKVGLEHEDAPVLRRSSMGEMKALLRPFSSLRIIPERFPVKSRLHRGWTGMLFNHLFVPVFNALPRAWVRSTGWHLMAYATK